jgi:hypothetical protein
MKSAGAVIGLLCASMAAAATIAGVPDSDPQRPTPRHVAAPRDTSAAGASRASVESQHDVAGSSKVDNRPTPGAGGEFQSPTAAGAASLHKLLETRARARPGRQTRGGNAPASSLSQSGSRLGAGGGQARQPASPTNLAASGPLTRAALGKRMTFQNVIPATGQPARIASRIKAPEHGGNSHTAQIGGAQVRRGFSQ